MDVSKWRRDANRALEIEFRQDREQQFDVVRVLLLYWQQSDSPGFEREAEELSSLFQDGFNFEVIHYRIPSSGAALMLDKEITRFLELLPSQRSLGIIHYGGHGDEDRDPPGNRRGVWASHLHGDLNDGNSVHWSLIQPKLGLANCNLILILDCCYAGQAARGGERIVPENIEFLAACGKGQLTPGPGAAQSFTKALIKEIKSLRESRQSIQMSEIATRLASQSASLKETPIYFPPSKYYTRYPFCLYPTPKSTALPSNDSHLAHLSLQMMFSSHISADLVDQIVTWLRSSAPRGVSGMKVIDIDNIASQTQSLHNFVVPGSNSMGPTTTIMNLSIASQRDIRAAWSTFQGWLGMHIRQLLGSFNSFTTSDKSQETVLVETFLHDFEDNLERVQRVIERGILSVPELFDETYLQNAVIRDDLGHLGITEALRARLMSVVPEFTNPKVFAQLSFSHGDKIGDLSGLVLEHTPEHGTILVEYKSVDGRDIRAVKLNISRMKRLAAVLHAASLKHFMTSTCLGITGESADRRQGVVFQLPAPDLRPVTLYSLLEQHQTHRRDPLPPTLGERFRLAYAVGQALMRWHAIGWLHQGIASYNVVFFTDKNRLVRYSEPYLYGFDCSREYDATSGPRPDVDDEKRDLYRHPDRQGSSPLKQHHKRHDIYSYGLLLVEIARWSRLTRSFQSFLSKNTPLGLHKEVIEKVPGVLSHSMGKAYARATVLCLRGDFGVDQDNEHGMALVAAFDKLVLGSLAVGLDIDGNSSTAI